MLVPVDAGMYRFYSSKPRVSLYDSCLACEWYRKCYFRRHEPVFYSRFTYNATGQHPISFVVAGSIHCWAYVCINSLDVVGKYSGLQYQIIPLCSSPRLTPQSRPTFAVSACTYVVRCQATHRKCSSRGDCYIVRVRVFYNTERTHVQSLRVSYSTHYYLPLFASALNR